MTILYEPVCVGAEHSPVNAALLVTALAAFCGEAVIFHAEANHLESVRELLPPDALRRIDWRKLSIAAREITDFRRRFRLEQHVVKSVLDGNRLSSPLRVISCAGTLAGIAALKAHLMGTRSAIRTAVVHHTGLSSLMASRIPRALLTRFNGNRVRHIVLGDWIRERVVQAAPSLRNALFSISHPYLFCHSVWTPLPDRGPVRFGFLGAATEGKGFDTFCDLAEHMHSLQHTLHRAVEFELVGRPPANFRCGAVSLVSSESTPPGGFVARELYEERTKQLHYTVFPFRSESYDMITSGSFVDTLAYLRPCIAMRHPVVESYFRRMGDIGYLCDSPTEMRDLAVSLLREPPVERYAQQCRNLMAGRRFLEPPSVAAELRAAFA